MIKYIKNKLSLSSLGIKQILLIGGLLASLIISVGLLTVYINSDVVNLQTNSDALELFSKINEIEKPKNIDFTTWNDVFNFFFIGFAVTLTTIHFVETTAAVKYANKYAYHDLSILEYTKSCLEEIVPCDDAKSDFIDLTEKIDKAILEQVVPRILEPLGSPKLNIAPALYTINKILHVYIVFCLGLLFTGLFCIFNEETHLDIFLEFYPLENEMLETLLHSTNNIYPIKQNYWLQSNAVQNDFLENSIENIVIPIKYKLILIYGSLEYFLYDFFLFHDKRLILFGVKKCCEYARVALIRKYMFTLLFFTSVKVICIYEFLIKFCF